MHDKIPYRLARAWPSFVQPLALYAKYLCSRDALGLKAERARDDRVSCIQPLAECAREQRYLAYN